jgi:hypothetical protein
VRAVGVRVGATAVACACLRACHFDSSRKSEISEIDEQAIHSTVSSNRCQLLGGHRTKCKVTNHD